MIKGRERAKPRSKYEEDGTSFFIFPFFYQPSLALTPSPVVACPVITGNHSTVWGSWYNLKSGQWGYACCHAILHGAYCTGTAGIAASAEEADVKSLLAKSAAFSAPPPVEALPPAHLKGKGKESVGGEDVPQFSKVRVGEGEIKLNKDKLEKALEEERKRKQEAEEEQSGGGFSMAGRKKPKYNNVSGAGGGEVTEEQLGSFSSFFFFLGYCFGTSAENIFSDACLFGRGLPVDPFA